MAAHPSSGARTGRRYTSFLIRCWRLGDGTERLQLEHIQSGARTRVVTLGEAVAWMRACWDASLGPSLSSDRDGGPPSQATGSARGEH
jgi:hypothetical protein